LGSNEAAGKRSSSFLTAWYMNGGSMPPMVAMLAMPGHSSRARGVARRMWVGMEKAVY
jgi:hypothetical protein